MASSSYTIECSECRAPKKKSVMMPSFGGECALGWQGSFFCLCQGCYAWKHWGALIIKKEKARRHEMIRVRRPLNHGQCDS